ncbi:MAG: hypothetical protein M1282_18650 [Chloroflexi bacterium]|nr:hypothetical protein [Chloroflexota bacterium]
MSCLLRDEEPIAVELDSNANPTCFNWQNQRHIIERIREQWEIDIGWWSEEGPTHRDIFAVTTDDGMLCAIYLNHLDGNWYFEKIYD